MKCDLDLIRNMLLRIEEKDTVPPDTLEVEDFLDLCDKPHALSLHIRLSIQKDILKFYNEKGIRYFLFGNGRTAIAHIQRSNIVIGNAITYQNGARVATCFYTNLGEAAIECDPELTEGLKDLQPKGKEFSIYGYPPEIVSIGFLQSLCNHPVLYVVQRKDIVRKVSSLRNGDGECVRIYGSSIQLTEEAAVQKRMLQKQIAQKQMAQKQIERKRIPLLAPNRHDKKAPLVGA